MAKGMREMATALAAFKDHAADLLMQVGLQARVLVGVPCVLLMRGTA